ncbi:MAG TPA: DNA-formamidopyrimidine glycosylase family protein, partial [Candidatus Marinimicrobia bacterium]|nr:DNA-formamidopyrimidine glycosylase family protein [Candidatus Neomarinimicrobiota bacterium]
MPELPEVQTIINDLIAANLVGQKVLEVEIHWQKIIAEPSAEKFTTEIQNREITKITRRGKFIVIE